MQDITWSGEKDRQVIHCKHTARLYPIIKENKFKPDLFKGVIIVLVLTGF